MIKLLLVRHGKTFANELGVWSGQTESKMTKEGLEGIYHLKEKLKEVRVDGIYSSPSIRALESVSILRSGMNVQNETIEKVEALKEIDFGKYEGKNFGWVQKNEPSQIDKMLSEGNGYIYPEGESLAMQHQRVAQWLNKWLGSHREGTYMMCAHGGTIRCILSELLSGNDSLHWHFKIDTASLTVVTITDGYAVIEALNYSQNQV